MSQNSSFLISCCNGVEETRLPRLTQRNRGLQVPCSSSAVDFNSYWQHAKIVILKSLNHPSVWRQRREILPVERRVRLHLVPAGVRWGFGLLTLFFFFSIFTFFPPLSIANCPTVQHTTGIIRNQWADVRSYIMLSETRSRLHETACRPRFVASGTPLGVTDDNPWIVYVDAQLKGETWRWL